MSKNLALPRAHTTRQWLGHRAAARASPEAYYTITKTTSALQTTVYWNGNISLINRPKKTRYGPHSLHLRMSPRHNALRMGRRQCHRIPSGSITAESSKSVTKIRRGPLTSIRYLLVRFRTFRRTLAGLAGLSNNVQDQSHSLIPSRLPAPFPRVHLSGCRSRPSPIAELS